MADIKCPICGEMNAPELELCTNCRSPLQTKPNIQSGQNPTKKHTAELEPILPQWLREARDAARNTEPQDSPDYLQTTENKPKPTASPPDLLAGLQSQTGDDEEEEVPDWLASITGASPKSRSAKDEPATDVRWVEMGGKDDFAQSENILAQPPSRGGQEDEVPAWLAGLQNESAPEKDELTDWLSDKDDEPAKEEPFGFTPTQDETPDWLKQMSADAESKSQQVSSQPASDAQFDVDTPDWLKQMSANAEPVEAKTQQDAPELNIDTPDWLSSLGGASENALGVESAAFAESSLPEKEAQALPPMDMPDWLKGSSEVQDEKPSQDTTTPLWLKPQVQSQEPEMPAWLSSSEETVYLDQQKDEPLAQDDLLGDVPDWLKAAAPEKTIFDSQDELKPEIDASETTDWFSSIQPSAETEVEKNVEPEKVDPFASMPAFTFDSQAQENLEGLFTEMPDWLSSASETPSSSTPTSITNEDVLPSSNLPSWVEAMRPSDSGLSQLTSSASDQTLESRGALAGLQGVLPAVPGFTPTSKPKAYSLKLNVNDEQLKHAGILEDILAAETSPVPIESFSTLLPSRALRWTLAFLMLAVIFSTTFLRTQIFALPRGVPNEVSAAIQVMQSIPENAAVLVAFDYEPSRAGEMEAAAAPLFDNLLLLKHPRLTFIATNETGSVLAERFISSGPLAVHNYQSGVTYSNLGYLPGGQLGIRAFAQNPSLTSPFDIFGQPAWASPTLQGVTALNQFTAMILITDNADAARVWVEQTQGVRGTIPFIVVASSQATPMIQPYYDSAQVTGIVPGLYGGAIFEQYNAGRPGTTRNYWDAYSIGMLIAMALVLGGGLWNLGVGLRERREDK
jgi:hypothetical protein